MPKLEYTLPKVEKLEKPDNEKIGQIEDKRFAKFLKKYLEISHDEKVPDIYKSLLLSPDIVSVLNNLKPATEISVPNEFWQALKNNNLLGSGELEPFKKILADKFNISATETIFGRDVTEFFIYNSKYIVKRIKEEFPEVLTWPANNDFFAWREANVNKGVDLDLVKGLYYGFPKSAINDYLKKRGMQINSEHRQSIATSGETYIVPEGELAADVKDRERHKSEFFKRFNKSQEIKAEAKKLEKFKAKTLAIRDELIAEFEKNRAKKE